MVTLFFRRLTAFVGWIFYDFDQIMCSRHKMPSNWMNGKGAGTRNRRIMHIEHGCIHPVGKKAHAR